MYVTLFCEYYLIGTESSDIMIIPSSSTVTSSLTSDITSTIDIVTSVEPTSGRSSKIYC